MDPTEFRFFSAVPGRVVPQYGVPGRMIGQRRVADADTGGFRWEGDPAAVIAIPRTACEGRYVREYARALAEGALVERTAAEWAAANGAPDPDPAPAAPAPKRARKE